jgi:hypothetical protein
MVAIPSIVIDGPFGYLARHAVQAAHPLGVASGRVGFVFFFKT